MTSRKVTEQDFRLPEFRDAIPDDYEFRADGKLVRKDRWEKGILSIVGVLGGSRRDFEIRDVVTQVERLVELHESWNPIEDFCPIDLPSLGVALSVKLTDGSTLESVEFNRATEQWTWRGIVVTAHVAGWRITPGSALSTVEDWTW